MKPIITSRTLVTYVANAGKISFVKAEDFGARQHYAWAGFDDDRIRSRFPRPKLVDLIAYPRGRSAVIDLIPDAPPVKQVATAVRGSERLLAAIDKAFVSLQQAIDAALDERLRLPMREAISHVDVFHAVVVVDTPIPTRGWNGGTSAARHGGSSCGLK